MKYRGVTIHKRKDANTWYTRHRINGKVHYISARTQQECYNKLKLLFKKEEQSKLKQLREPKAKEPKAMTFIEWYHKWLELYKQNVKQTTIKDYNCCLKYLQDIYNKPIINITSIEIIEILNKITFERRKQITYEFLNGIFEKALKNDLINKNIIKSIDKPKHKKNNGKALTNNDEKELENILIKNNGDMFLICLYQGLRKGEMLALTRNDIDFENKTLTINKSFNFKGEISTTKNIYSNRIIPIFNNTLSILQKYKNKQGRLFNISYIGCEREFNKLTQNLNNKYTIHSLRHTFITKCQEAGIPLHIIQKWVGHNIGSTITNTVYTHSRELAELENIEKLNNYNLF